MICMICHSAHVGMNRGERHSERKVSGVFLLAPRVDKYLAHEQADSDTDCNFNHANGQRESACVLCCGTLITL
jgi:hypothetical protein